MNESRLEVECPVEDCRKICKNRGLYQHLRKKHCLEESTARDLTSKTINTAKAQAESMPQQPVTPSPPAPTQPAQTPTTHVLAQKSVLDDMENLRKMCLNAGLAPGFTENIVNYMEPDPDNIKILNKVINWATPKTGIRKMIVEGWASHRRVELPKDIRESLETEEGKRDEKPNKYKKLLHEMEGDEEEQIYKLKIREKKIELDRQQAELERLKAGKPILEEEDNAPKWAKTMFSRMEGIEDYIKKKEEDVRLDNSIAKATEPYRREIATLRNEVTLTKKQGNTESETERKLREKEEENKALREHQKKQETDEAIGVIASEVKELKEALHSPQKSELDIYQETEKRLEQRGLKKQVATKEEAIVTSTMKKMDTTLDVVKDEVKQFHRHVDKLTKLAEIYGTQIAKARGKQDAQKISAGETPLRPGKFISPPNDGEVLKEETKQIKMKAKELKELETLEKS